MSKTRLLFADATGQVYDHPHLLAAVRTGDLAVLPIERPIALPEGATLCLLPGRRPIGVDPKSGQLVVLNEATVGRRTFAPHAVGATLPPGYTRTFLPAGHGSPIQREKGRAALTPGRTDMPLLPQWAYTAAGIASSGPVAWGLRTDRRRHWSAREHCTPDLPGRIERVLARSDNPIYRQLARCALEYRCFTAQNTFYVRDEGAIPSSATCNAACLGCLSAQSSDVPQPSHERIVEPPTAEEMAEVGARHLAAASGRAMVSFGQGCEGEPLLRWREIARAVRLMRENTLRGSIHINTNGSLPRALAALIDAGLDSCRVSINSASEDLYAAYFRPKRYGLRDVKDSIRAAVSKGAHVALNLLTFPGVTDRKREVERLCKLVATTGVHQIQMRPLAIDPDIYMEVASRHGAGGEPIGIRALIATLQKARPGLAIGNFSLGKHERAMQTGR